MRFSERGVVAIHLVLLLSVAWWTVVLVSAPAVGLPHGEPGPLPPDAPSLTACLNVSGTEFLGLQPGERPSIFLTDCSYVTETTDGSAAWNWTDGVTDTITGPNLTVVESEANATPNGSLVFTVPWTGTYAITQTVAIEFACGPDGASECGANATANATWVQTF